MLWRRTTAFRDSLPPTASVLELQGHFKRRHSEKRTGNVSTLSHLTTVGGLTPGRPDRLHRMLCARSTQLRKGSWFWLLNTKGGIRGKEGSTDRSQSSGGRSQGVSTGILWVMARTRLLQVKYDRECQWQIPDELDSLKGASLVKTNSSSHLKQAVRQHASAHFLVTIAL